MAARSPIPLPSAAPARVQQERWPRRRQALKQAQAEGKLVAFPAEFISPVERAANAARDQRRDAFADAGLTGGPGALLGAIVAAMPVEQQRHVLSLLTVLGADTEAAPPHMAAALAFARGVARPEAEPSFPFRSHDQEDTR